MTFEELFARVGARADSDDHDEFMADSAITDLQELRSLARPVTPGRHTAEENARTLVTELLAGDLHLKRWSHLLRTRMRSDGLLDAAAAELYQAVLALRTVIKSPEGPPPGFDSVGAGLFGRRLFGSEPDPETRGNIAYFLLANAPEDADRHYHALAVDLLRTAVEALPPTHPGRHEWRRLLDMADRRRRPVELDWEQILIDETSRWLFSQEPPERVTVEEIDARWEETTDRLWKRLMSVTAESRPELPDESVSDDAAALLSALRRPSPSLTTTQSRRRYAQACHLNAIVHILRAAFGTRVDREAEIARAVIFSTSVDQSENLIPGPAGLLIGRDARPEVRVHHATQWLIRPKSGSVDPALLPAAIILLVEVVRSCPPATPDHAQSLANLATAYGLRYERTGVGLDLDQAIACAENTLAVTAEDDPMLAARRGNLAVLRLHHARRTRMPVDHDRALAALEEAVAVTPDDSPDLSRMLSNLGTAYSERRLLPGRRPGQDHAPANITDLNRAIECTERGLTVGGDQEVTRELLCNLGVNYRERYRILGELPDIELAIATHERHLTGLDVGDPAQLKIIPHLAIAYEERFTANGTPVAPEILRGLGRRVESSNGGLPHHRLWACRSLGVLACRLGEYPMARTFLREAVELLALVFVPENEWQDREQLVGEHMGLVNEAIAAHCLANDPRGAVDIAELGREDVLPTLSGVQSDLNALEDQHPGVAEELHRVRRLLNQPHGTLIGDSGAQAIGHSAYRPGQRLRFQSEYRELLDHIRGLPGFERFLLRAGSRQHGHVTDAGSVVLVNADRLCGDAIIIPPGGDLLHIPLSKLAVADVISRGREFLAAVHFGAGLAGALRRRRVISKTLAWLWDAIAEPVLASLPPNSRIWWMPTGTLSLFPLHAAGIPGKPGVLDLAVSSYTPTLSALADAQARTAASVRTQLTVAMERTPGLPDLPDVVREAGTLRAQYPHALYLEGPDANTGRVLSALREATWAHFACHASLDFRTPSQGGLYLHDGRLSVPDISSLHLRQAELAYLSACSSAGKGIRHADQSISLASAFQMIGFRHVVASLWPLQDSHAAAVAAMFYERMPVEPTADAAPHVLRDIAIDLRQAEPDRPEMWTPLIHLGP
ncbi:CHAT domain-containing protein [Actinosynnema sp. NPDC023587]|uniref:CHAT domain-containing protein n=1 Tax=Actinosynnema sp. NPDC023587 TaxID=3154695 RepID=UPI0034038260